MPERLRIIGRMSALGAVSTATAVVLRAPLLFVAVVLITIAAAVPFAIVVGTELDAALAAQQVSGASPSEIDADWWQEFEAHATGLAATFTPQVLGFAAPLDALSGLLDGTRRPWILAIPVALFVVLWAYLWGGILQRFAGRRGLGVRGFLRACASSFPAFLGIGGSAAIAIIALYLTVHALLFGPVFARVAAAAPSERAAFLWRIVFYFLFVTLVMAVNAVAELARVHVAITADRRLARVVPAAFAFLRAHAPSIALLYAVNLVLFAAWFAVYGLLDFYGGAQVGGWRGVLLGQTFIVGRLFIKLLFAASLVVFVKQMLVHVQRSVDPANPGPPAAT